MITLYISFVSGTICFAVIISQFFDMKNQLPIHPDSFSWKIHSGFLLYSMRSFSGIIITILFFISSILSSFSCKAFIHIKNSIHRVRIDNKSIVFFINKGIILNFYFPYFTLKILFCNFPFYFYYFGSEILN